MTDLKPIVTAGENVDPRLLREAFEQFMATSKVMEKAYHELQAKIEELNLELAEKNRQLSEHLTATERARTQLADVLASLDVAVVVFDREGRLARLNRAGADLFGVAEDEAEGLTLAALLARRFAALSRADVLLAGADLVPETEIGSLDDEGGRVLRVSTHRMRGVAGGEGRILLAEDVTDAAQRRVAAQRHQRLAAMGELAVQIVHQMRNPMGGIELFASLLQRDLAAQPDLAELAEKIRRGIGNLNLVVGNLLSFAKGAEPVVQRVDLADLLRRAVNEIEPQLKQNGVTVRFDLDPDDIAVSADPELLRQAFLNLMINAVQAMPAGGTMAVAATHAAGGGATCVAVRDTGVGIQPDARARIFDPFFSTRERGTGLGLALVHNIVKAHGGTVEVETAPGQGSTFTISLPG